VIQVLPPRMCTGSWSGNSSSRSVGGRNCIDRPPVMRSGSSGTLSRSTKGIPDAETFFRLTGEIEKLTSFPLDVVQWEHLEPEFREVILHKGKVVYESPE